MPNRFALAGIGVLASVALASPAWAPLVLRDVEWFAVRHLEIAGTRLVEAREVLAVADLGEGTNLWAELAPIERAILRHPSLETVTITRRPPHTLRIRVQEKRPIAYVELGSLVPITSRGEILPVDPTGARLDLPVVRGAWREMDPESRGALLSVIETLAAADPELLAKTSELRPEGTGGRAVRLEHASAEIVLPTTIEARRLSQLRAVLSDLQRRDASADPGAPAPRVDARFEDQIVVRIHSSAS